MEVFSKTAEDEVVVRWMSEGDGEFEVSDVHNVGFTRGTKIVLHLRADCREFAREKEIENIIKKHSLFINYPIKVNGKVVNQLQAIWYRDR